MKAYLANGLFSEADRMYNDYLAKLIRTAFPDLTLFVPQESDINDKSTYADSQAIAETDKENLLESDFMIAVIDGVEIDSGVACEIGMFSMTGKPIIGIYTDIRQQGRDNNAKIQALIADGTENQFMYRNLFVIGIIKSNGVIIDGSKIIKAINDIINKKGLNG